AEDGIRDFHVTGVQTCALPILKKKIEFIFALCHHPDILILDEPTAGVDIASRRRIKEDLIRFMEDGNKSIVMATHTIDEINQLRSEERRVGKECRTK